MSPTALSCTARGALLWSCWDHPRPHGPTWTSLGSGQLPVPGLGPLRSCILLTPTELARAVPGPSRRLEHSSWVRTRIWCGGGVGLVVLDGGSHGVRCSHGRLCRVEIGFLLELPNVLLVPDSLIAKPVGHLQWREVARVRGTKCLAGQSRIPLRCHFEMPETQPVPAPGN